MSYEIDFTTGKSDELNVFCEFIADVYEIKDPYGTGDYQYTQFCIEDITIESVNVNSHLITPASWLEDEIIQNIVVEIENNKEMYL